MVHNISIQRYHAIDPWDSSTSAILGLTVLALGNCVADWVADTLVARAGKPEMAFASCFGSPLLSHVLGLSIALIVSHTVVGCYSDHTLILLKYFALNQWITELWLYCKGNSVCIKMWLLSSQVKIAVNHGEPYRFHIHTPEYSQVKLSWIFLGISLVGCIIVFPAFKFSPPRY